MGLVNINNAVHTDRAGQLGKTSGISTSTCLCMDLHKCLSSFTATHAWEKNKSLFQNSALLCICWCTEHRNLAESSSEKCLTLAYPYSNDVWVFTIKNVWCNQAKLQDSHKSRTKNTSSHLYHAQHTALWFAKKWRTTPVLKKMLKTVAAVSRDTFQWGWDMQYKWEQKTVTAMWAQITFFLY